MSSESSEGQNEKPVLLTCHGYTGYPEEMEPFGRFFENRGFEWINLTLPGHNSTPEILRTTTEKIWREYVDEQVQIQIEAGKQVVFAGLSLGGAMTLYALENHPQIRAGVALAAPTNILNPFQRFLSMIPFLGFWISKEGHESLDVVDPVENEAHRDYKRHHTDSVKQLQRFVSRTRKNLGKIEQPLMLIHGTADRVIPVQSAEIIAGEINSQVVEKLIVKAGHVLTREKQRELWFEQAYEFVQSQLE